MVEFFFSQLVQLVQSRSGLRRSDVQYKVGLCMINHREVEVYIPSCLLQKVLIMCLCCHVCVCYIPTPLWTLIFICILASVWILPPVQDESFELSAPVYPNSVLTADALFAWILNDVPLYILFCSRANKDHAGQVWRICLKASVSLTIDAVVHMPKLQYSWMSFL